MNDWIEIWAITQREKCKEFGKLLYVQHRIHSGRQLIILTIPTKPTRASIGPYLLLDLDPDDNMKQVETKH